MKRKKIVIESTPDLRKFIRFGSSDSASFHGKIGRVPIIRQAFIGMPPEIIAEAIGRLKKAGVIVPEHSSFGVDNFYSRIGSRRRPLGQDDLGILRRKPFRQNNLEAYLQRYFATVAKGRKPNTSTINKLLDSAAKSIGIMHASNVIHGHPRLHNLVPVKSQCGIVDFKMASVVKINWQNLGDIINNTNNDIMHLCGSWNEVEKHHQRNPVIVRMIWRRKKRMINLIVDEYPIPQNLKEEIKHYYISRVEDILKASRNFRR